MMLKKSSFLFWLIILAVGCFLFIWFKNNNSNSSLIGVYVDDEYTSSIPSESSGYVVEKIICDNDAVGEWDYSNWGLLVKNMTKKSKCNIYFKKGIRLADTITLVDTTGKCPTVNEDGTVNVTSAESENPLLCMAPDNYGESYYFRGNVQNNYVYFAGFYWRIVRINGDGSIRMIYDGTIAHENGESSEDRIIGKSVFNNLSDDNTYIGYMYGSADSSTYEETHANTNDSIIKTYIDTWYQNNLKDTDFEEKLADTMFCGDRTVSTGDGYGKIATSYKWHYSLNYNNLNLNCIQKNDAYTRNDVIHGTGTLKYSIGLISTDEATLGGGYNTSNTGYYLFTGNRYWTMTAADFNGSNANNRLVLENGRTELIDWTRGYYGVKPVINLKSGSLKKGNGTINNPYKVS